MSAAPDKLVLRDKPTVGRRLGKRGGLVAGGIAALLFGVIIWNTESRKIANSEKPRAAASEGDARLRPSTEVADVLTRGVTGEINLTQPEPAPLEVGELLSQTAAPAPVANAYTVPDLGGSSPASIDLAESDHARMLREQKEQIEQEARRSKTVVADWQSDDSDRTAAAAMPMAMPTMPNPADMAQQLAGMAGGMPGMPGFPGAPGPTDQERKRSFVDDASQANEHVSSATRMMPRPFELKTGTIFRARTVRGINSDLPGEITAMISDNVYDTATGRHLLVPAGSTLFGVYDSEVAYGQNRAMTVWTRLIFPDGSTVELGGMSGADGAGYSGFRDQVKNHYGRLVGFALLTSAMSSAFQLSQPEDTSNGVLTPRQIAAAEVGKEITALGTEIARRNLNVQPTITVRPGFDFTVTVNRDIAFAAPYRPYVTR